MRGGTFSSSFKVVSYDGIQHIVPTPLPPPGLFSCIMRDLANMATDSPKWIVLDGDIDPMWIESLNTVMDDNKVENCDSLVTQSISF